MALKTVFYRNTDNFLPADTIGGITSPWIAGPIIGKSTVDRLLLELSRLLDADMLGRRAGMFIGCAIICIGEL